jgi:hypothetical protein
MPDGGHHTQRALVRRGIMNIIGGEQCQAIGLRQSIKALDPGYVIASRDSSREMAQVKLPVR